MKNTYKRFYTIILISLLLTAITVNLSAESMDKRAVITKIETEIDGSTKRKYLLGEIDLFEGKEFTDYESLVEYMEENTQDLINMRVFEMAEYELLETSSDDQKTKYTVTLRVRDTWNIYPIPYPKYSSNTGFRLGIKFFYFNAFGTLMDFQLFTGMNIDKNTAKNEWEISDWNISPGLEGINLWGQEFSVSLDQSFSTVKKYENDTLQQEFTVHTSSIGIGTKFQFPLDLYYSMEPSVSFNYGIKELRYDSNNVELPQYNTRIDYEFFNFTFNHELGYDCLDWIGNFREGYSVSLSNALIASYDLENDVTFKSDFKLGAKGFWIISKYLNLSSQINGAYSYNYEMTGMGEYLRGVVDDYMYGYMGAFMSVDLNISVFDWDGVGEIQIRPFFEIGAVKKSDVDFDLENDFAYTTGADFVLYLDKLNSMQARATIGFDLSNPDWSSRYEIDITSSVSY